MADQMMQCVYLDDEINELTAIIAIKNAFIFLSMMEHPAEFGSYFSFAPLE